VQELPRELPGPIALGQSEVATERAGRKGGKLFPHKEYVLPPCGGREPVVLKKTDNKETVYFPVTFFDSL
jgi:hypothetical protein